MKKHFVIFLLILVACLPACSKQEGKISKNSSRVKEAVDWATLRLEDGNLVKLIGMNCTDKSELAQKILNKMTKGELVRIERDNLYDKNYPHSDSPRGAYVCPGSERASEKYVDEVMDHYSRQAKHEPEKMANLINQLAPIMKQQHINTLEGACMDSYNSTLIQLNICKADTSIEFSQRSNFLALEKSHKPGTYLEGTASGQLIVHQQQTK